MSVRPVFQLGNPVLREKSSAVADPTAGEIHELVRDLADTLAHWRAQTGYGRGIAAPQLGELKRVIFLQLPGADPWPLVNPEIVERSAERIIVWDACLSFLSIFMQVERHRRITVRYQKLNGEIYEVEAGDERDLSELLQHEIDHLDGKLFIDRISRIKRELYRRKLAKRTKEGKADGKPSAARI